MAPAYEIEILLHYNLRLLKCSGKIQEFQLTSRTKNCWSGLTKNLGVRLRAGKAAVQHLYWGDGSLLCGGDPLLHAAHVRGKGGLVTHSGGNTTQQGGHLRTSLENQ